MPNRFTEAARLAREATNKELTDEIAAVSINLNRDKIQALLPTKREKQDFIELMAQVEADTAMDEKIAYLQENIQSAGLIVIKLLKLLM